jgi:ubiquinone/menaquinone biosynthesis C-methylase UbiE
VDAYDQSIAADHVRHRRVHPEVVRSLVSIGALSPASSVLDVGCGTGNYLFALSEIVGCDCWGIDPSEAMLAKAQSQLTKAHLFCAAAERMKLSADQFDLVFAVDVIHYLTNRSSVFHRCLQVLRPGGKIMLSY